MHGGGKRDAASDDHAKIDGDGVELAFAFEGTRVHELQKFELEPRREFADIFDVKCSSGTVLDARDTVRARGAEEIGGDGFIGAACGRGGHKGTGAAWRPIMDRRAEGKSLPVPVSP